MQEGASDAKDHVSAMVNGDNMEFLCEPDQTLLDVLRDELNMTGSKEGCSTGDCGSLRLPLMADWFVPVWCCAEVSGCKVKPLRGWLMESISTPFKPNF